ncbi:MAG: ethanolamine ammonia-lyase reactivating factor EutA [Defluviicoccus sp.]|nr:ethanolamine ammonia-lyase reactivating factor EutA [Defluviicoccus sp.]
MHELDYAHFHPASEREAAFIRDTIWKADNVELTTVGVDVGSSTSHLMFARVHLQRLSEALSSRFVVVARDVLWRSPILLTPYRPDYTIDADALKTFFEGAFDAAGLSPDDIDSGAVILTGEALKRVNARAIADLFAEESGKFVCASAGHNLESVMAAHGSGAVRLSKTEDKVFLNVDIGGGTTKFALCRGGEIVSTAAVAVGGRLLAHDADGALIRIEGPALEIARDIGISLTPGAVLEAGDRRALVRRMVDVLVGAIRQEEPDSLARDLMVTAPLAAAPRPEVIAFSGGVSEYVYEREAAAHGDLGKSLAHHLHHALTEARIPYPVYDPGQGIRATVVGASQFSVQVSGNTIMVSDEAALPLRNVPVVRIRAELSGDIDPAVVEAEIGAALLRNDIDPKETNVALAFRWQGLPLHGRLHDLASGLCAGLRGVLSEGRPIVLMMEGDTGRTIGHILKDEFDVGVDIVSVDGVELKDLDYVDIGAMIHPTEVVPLIIKSLLFSTPDASARASAASHVAA